MKFLSVPGSAAPSDGCSHDRPARADDDRNGAHRSVRRWILAVVASTLGLLALDTAPAFAQSRTLELYFTHTRETIKVVYKRDGQYVASGLRDLNRFLRDWRRNEATKMDPELFDLIWELQQEFGGTINVVSAYRSPATNSLLRSRSRGVAKNSQHMAGRALDFYIKGANLAKLRGAGMRRQVGGVGYYPTSGSPFVHMDTGSVRAWPRMSRSELARLFPDGKTLHMPSDGKPLSGYAEAQRLEREGKLAKLDGGSSGGGLLAFIGLGRSARDSGGGEPGDRVRPGRQTAPVRASKPPQAPAKVDDAPVDAPVEVQTASLGPAPVSSAEVGGRGLFRQLPSVSLGGLIGRSRRNEAPEVAPEVQAVALPSQPLTAVAVDQGEPEDTSPEAPAAPVPTAAAPLPPVAPATSASEPSSPSDTRDPAPEAEDEPAEPIVVAALPPQRPTRALAAPGTADLPPAFATLAYARDEAIAGDVSSPQNATAAIIPRTGLVALPEREVETIAVEPVPASLSRPQAAALLSPVTGATPDLIADTSGVASESFATLVAPDRTQASEGGVLMAQGFLGAPRAFRKGPNDWLETSRFTGTRITVFASPRS